MKKCIICGRELPPRKSKYCSKACLNKRNAEYAMERRREACDPTVGLGKGGSNKKGKDHKQFKSGMGLFYQNRREMRKTIKHCQKCGKDLTNANRYEWCVHHKDHDRSNNDRDNLVMWYKSCHQIHHDCQITWSK